MRKLVLSFLAGAAVLTAGATSRQLLSVTEEAWGDKYVTSYEYDAEGRLVKVTDGYSVYTFDYSQLASKKFMMTRVDAYEWGDPETTVTEMTLNDNNLVVKAVEIYNGEIDDDYSTYEYTDGYLTNYKYIRPDEVEETKISYTDGRITKVENIEESESECETITFEYDGIKNPGEIVMFDNIFDIDLDDMEYAAMTGMLGKIYNELPVKAVSTDLYGSSEENFAWTVDAEGYASSLEITNEWDNYKYSFEWSGTTGVGSVSVDNAAESQFFSVDGKRVASDAKGIVIERRADGTSVKRINR